MVFLEDFGVIVDIKQEILNTVANFPTGWEEISRRAVLLSKLVERDPIQRTYETAEGVFSYYGWNDGAGDCMVLFLHPETQQALFVGYSHESSLNFYDTDESSVQEKLYTPIPKIFEGVVRNQPETYELLHVDLPNGDKIYTATAVVVYTDGLWSPTEGYLEVASDFNDTGDIGFLSEVFAFTDVSVMEKEFDDDSNYVQLAFKEYNAAKPESSKAPWWKNFF